MIRRDKIIKILDGSATKLRETWFIKNQSDLYSSIVEYCIDIKDLLCTKIENIVEILHTTDSSAQTQQYIKEWKKELIGIVDEIFFLRDIRLRKSLIHFST